MEVELTRTQRVKLALFGKVYLVRRKINDWLNGVFICIRCGKKFYLFTFGYGKTICPSCYRGENPIVFFEDPIMRSLHHG